jgi:hypothetical protein
MSGIGAGTAAQEFCYNSRPQSALAHQLLGWSRSRNANHFFPFRRIIACPCRQLEAATKTDSRKAGVIG